MNGNAIATTWKAAVLVVAFAPSAVLSAEDAAATFRFESDVEAWQPLQVEFQSPDEAHAYWLALEKGTNAPTEIDACVDEIRLEPIERLSIFEQYRLTPTPEELEQIHGVHPRLYLDAERIAELRREVNDTHAPLWRELRELADRAVRRGPPAYREDDNWSGSEQLWQREVGNTMPVLAMAYVVSGDRKYVEAAQAWALASCGYGDDGASHEGVGYWEYGVEYLLKFMHLARQRLGVDLYRYDWWRNTARYPLYLSLPRGAWARSNSIVDIADCPRGHWYGPDYLLRGLAREYRDPQAQWLAHESDAADVTSPGAPWLNLVRYDPAVPVIPPDELPTLRHFDDMDIAMTFGTLSSAGDLPLPTGRDATSLTCARGIDRLLLIQRHPVEASHPYTYFYMDYRKGGGLCVYDRTSGDLAKIVDSTDGEILTADLDFDARRIVFAWRRGDFPRNEQKGYRPGKHAPVQIYTVNVDGSDLRQVTAGPNFNFDPCWLPDGRIAFVSTRGNQWVYCNSGPVGVLHRMDSDGSNVIRLSANVLNDFTPSVLSDGRILFTRWEYVDKSPLAVQSLWAIRPDGTGLESVFGNRVLSPSTFIETQQVPGSGRLLCTMTGHTKPIRGAVGLIDPQQGVNAQAAIRNLTPEIDVPPVDFPDGDLFHGPYESPYPLNDQCYLVSRDGDLLLRDYAGRRETVLLERSGELGFYCARPLRARTRPPALPSVLPPRDQAGLWAAVFVQDVYQGLEPDVQRGEVQRLCVVEECPRDAQGGKRRCRFGVMNVSISCGSTYATRVVWGFADVAKDGSAYFQVPAERPVFFLALDRQGRAVQRMRSYTHLMPGEVQGCVGCHATRNTLPPEPRSAADVFGKAPQSLEPPEWGAAIGFDYETIVQPVLDKHCVECHRGADAAARVQLTGERTRFFSTSYDTLAMGRKPAPPHRFVGQNALVENPYTNWISGFHGVEQNILDIEPRRWGSPRSRLADLVLSGHPDEKGQPQVRLSRDETQRILTWIDLNVPFYGSFAHAADDMDRTAYLAEPRGQ